MLAILIIKTKQCRSILLNQEFCLHNFKQVLHLQAVRVVLRGTLHPPIGKPEPIIKQWLSHITVCRNAVESILNLPSEHPYAKETR